MVCRQICLITLVAGIASSCTSFEGIKLPLGGSLPNKKIGMPFSLPRPVFKLAISPNATDATKADLVLTTSYVPDPSQTYTLRLDPGLFTTNTLKMEYSEAIPGTLSSVGGAGTDQVVPTITALGTFMASIIGGAAGTTFDKATDKKPRLESLVSKIESICPSSENNKAGAEIAADLRLFLPTRLSPSDQHDAAAWAVALKSVRTLYFYKSSAQRECLAKVSAKLRDTELKAIPQLKCALLGMKSNAENASNCTTGGDSDTSDNSGPVNKDSQKFRANLKKVLEASDIAALTSMLQQTQRDLAETAATSADKLKVLQARETILKNGLNITARSKGGITDQVEFLNFFAFMPESVWRARYILYFRTQRGICIAEAAQGSQGRCFKSVTADTLDDVLTEIDASIAGVADQKMRFHRLVNLQNFLTDAPQRDVQGGTAPAAQEYASIRQEHDTLQGVYTSAVNDIMGKNNDSPDLVEPDTLSDIIAASLKGTLDVAVAGGAQKINQINLHDVQMETSAFVANSQKPGWQPAGQPEFIIVVEPDVPEPISSTK